MINPNNPLPLSAQKHLSKVTKASAMNERKQKVESATSPPADEPPKQPDKKRPRKGLLDIYV
ncbi:hypothetical protein [Photobacterium nomapromontoriensis]|uniref:hypothetical protein n=1 Tax=Photobacterium nomapromontoriensis TaxID=2910237 RepID=UPI003D14437B